MHCMPRANTGAWVVRIELSGPAEEQVILRHCVVDARAGKNQAIHAAERGDHDRRRHDARGNGPEHHRHNGSGHAILGRGLNLSQSQYGQINEVTRDIKSGHDAYPKAERQREIAAGIAHLTRSKRDVVPRIRGKERSDHGGSHECNYAPVPGRPTPEVVEIGRDCGRIPAEDKTQSRETHERDHFRHRKDVLNDGAGPDAASVDEG